MTHSHAVVVPVLMATMASQIAIWGGLFAVWAGQRASGRRAVEAELRRLGERAVTIEAVPLREIADRAGLLSLHVFRVTARARDGATRTYLWAYEPGPATGSRGLKRLAHGIWIPA